MVSPAPEPFRLSEHARHVIAERAIRLEWVAATLESPSRSEADRDDAALLHALRRIDDFGGRVLRVVYNPSLRPPLIVTAYFDRSMKDKM
ncbi:MAG: DUF4258 domain-containing protein [Phycisphaerales bacterium]